MVEYSPAKVIPKDLVSTFFVKSLKCFKFSRLQYMSHPPTSSPEPLFRIPLIAKRCAGDEDVTPPTWFSACAIMVTDWLGM